MHWLITHRPAYIVVKRIFSLCRIGSGVEQQLLQVDIAVGLWVTRVRFQPGVTLERRQFSRLVSIRAGGLNPSIAGTIYYRGRDRRLVRDTRS